MPRKNLKKMIRNTNKRHAGDVPAAAEIAPGGRIIIEKSVPVKTAVGIFENYRDGIILENIEWQHRQMVFYCTISSHAIKNDENIKLDREYNFKIIFEDVISLFHAEYDTYEAICPGRKGLKKYGYAKPKVNGSIFEMIENSNYIKALPAREEYVGKVRHYCLTTYDDVFNIIAKSYTVEFL
ncbi:MAG: hypothetical protein LBK58_08565 [Prevotellaceae bacterium]|nr:hypothetical protein [Prevotellaceae bacterium]